MAGLGSAAAAFLLVLVVASVAGAANDDKIYVHIVPHSHDDVGWLKTVDEYFYGGNITWPSEPFHVQSSTPCNLTFCMPLCQRVLAKLMRTSVRPGCGYSCVSYTCAHVDTMCDAAIMQASSRIKSQLRPLYLTILRSFRNESIAYGYKTLRS